MTHLSGTNSPSIGPDYIVATYRLVTRDKDLRKRAESIAVGLTVGSWTDLPAARQAQLKPYCGTVGETRILAEHQDGSILAEIEVGYPVRNLTPRIPALLTTVFGKLSMDGDIKLVGLRLPEAFVRQFPGPKFGVAGVRQRLGVEGRPLIMSIFKSCIGMPLDALVEHFTEQALGGVDLIKDDEIFFSEQLATPEARVAAYVRAAERVAGTTGRKVAYAVNLTGPTYELRDRARRLADLGAGALLFNVFAYGLDILQELAADPAIQVPIMAHPAVAGALYAAPRHGIAASIVLGQLLRLAGADIVIYPSPYGSVTLAKEEGAAVLGALRGPSPHKPCLPAPSAGIHPGMVPVLLRDFGTDFIVNAGGAIHGHPGGATAGGQAFVAAVQAAISGRPLREAAQASEPLAQAIARWGVAE
ncbi:2,3-diketo-5-methylthiopentyl-1-phosphate enolase [Alicyclobacillus cellulosilyticus]|uniref:2,3-diketo-5-methylthiopentyl-1-phosphate enolase n=1 Tax=Alicyclobacillus cellulosilyticus TaxID=1003997 RepID=A0A917KA89_9BACL|nr:2,3-diketo-5-methylthiopentyl-1-phosphate enolase [Alicyclobacillus cellulosilyticus]GGJ06821.1 2,3-diketo-5-methylthiopentyl-1-phosphate enolase [Alicyclobacillus cellulosilyticus]